MSYGENGSVIGPINTPTSSVASGVWSLGEVAEAQRDGIWPNPTQGWVAWWDAVNTSQSINSKVSLDVD